MNFHRLLLPVLLAAVTVSAETSDLWGTAGERWDPAGRLPDFSHAGYHSGEAPLPDVPRGVSVKAFGAKGDGVTDDTRAFAAALDRAPRGAIEVPAGRYVITDILEVTRPGIVLRGEGSDKSILCFSKPLEEIRPAASFTTDGRPTSKYSWSGGFIWFTGQIVRAELARVTAEARRGENAVEVSNAGSFQPGQRIAIVQTDSMSNTLATALYSGDPGDVSKLRGSVRASLVCRVVKITGRQLHFERPLRFDVKPEWKPLVTTFEPDVTESGVEDLGFEFPNTPYLGHFTERGFNAVAFTDVANCWARRLRIVNADSGIFTQSWFCTVEDVAFESVRTPDATGSTGHHGFNFEGEDNLFARFDFRTRFLHDITVDHGAAGNVSARGRGVDLTLDHHKRACYENLFVDIDAGAGTRLWRSGGGAGLGKHCAARGTFWNIRAAQPMPSPPPAFGPPSINLVAVQIGQPSEKNATNRWIEAIEPGKITPRDIHAAQRERRVNGRKK